MTRAASTAMVSVPAGQSSEPSSRRSANPEFWSRCTGICLLRGTVSCGSLVVSRDDAPNILAELWSVPHADARERLAKALSSLGPDAKPQPRPGFFDLAFLPGVLWNAKVPGCLLDMMAWDMFMRKTVVGGPRSQRGTSLEEAEQQQPRGRSSGRRVPEGAYAKAAAKRGPAAKPMPAPKPKPAAKRKPSTKKAAAVLQEAEALHRRGSKKRNVSHRDEHEDVVSDIGDCGGDREQPFVRRGEVHSQTCSGARQARATSAPSVGRRRQVHFREEVRACFADWFGRAGPRAGHSSGPSWRGVSMCAVGWECLPR
jgi:hypothetical protein